MELQWKVCMWDYEPTRAERVRARALLRAHEHYNSTVPKYRPVQRNFARVTCT